MVIEWNDEEVLAKVRQKIVDGLEVVGEFVEGEAKRNIVQHKLVDTGNLLSSITHEVDADKLTVTIGTAVEYAHFVELGTRKMQPHPYLRPALDEHIEDIKRIFRNAK